MTTPSILETINHMKIAKDKECSYFVMEVSSHGYWTKERDRGA